MCNRIMRYNEELQCLLEEVRKLRGEQRRDTIVICSTDFYSKLEVAFEDMMGYKNADGVLYAYGIPIRQEIYCDHDFIICDKFISKIHKSINYNSKPEKMEKYKESFKVKDYTNKEVEVGDRVRIIDGSSLTPVEKCNDYGVIVEAYPNLTGLQDKLQYIDAEVVKVGIKNRVSEGVCGSGYLQDIKIRMGSGLFRLSSGMVEIRQKVNKEIKLEEGRWYKYDGGIACFNKEDSHENFGFRYGEFVKDIYFLKSCVERKATHEEVELALIEESNRIGYSEESIVRTLYAETYKISGSPFHDKGLRYNRDSNTLFFNGLSIFKKGNWAKIIQTISKEEAEKKLGKKIID